MSALVPYSEIERMALAVAKSGLFGVKNVEQAAALMLIAQAEGLHPAVAARDYHVISGRPTLKADAMLARFQQAGGKVKWLQMDDKRVAAEFSHPAGGTVEIDWTAERAKTAGITNDMHRKYPRQMLRARVISEGVRTVFPGVTSGLYTPEEMQDVPAPRVTHLTPEEPRQTLERDYTEEQAELEACATMGQLGLCWQGLSVEARKALVDVKDACKRRIEAALAEVVHEAD